MSVVIYKKYIKKCNSYIHHPHCCDVQGKLLSGGNWQAYQVPQKIWPAEMDYFNEKMRTFEEGEVMRRKTEGKEKGDIEIYVGVVGAKVLGISHFIKNLTILVKWK